MVARQSLFDHLSTIQEEVDECSELFTALVDDLDEETFQNNTDAIEKVSDLLRKLKEGTLYG